jgi:hypothetical protein
MNIFRLKGNDVLDAASPSAAEEPVVSKPESWLSERKRSRRERDAERGYSVNVKQVVLAFAVEFWIIGLIVVGTYLLIEDSGKSREEVFSALLLPAALAMVELARVPLAVATRTQTALHIKLFAALGVLAAITVTSFSLSQLGWKTFDTRIADAVRAGDRLNEARQKKAAFDQKLAQAARDTDQKLQARDNKNKMLADAQAQLTQIKSNAGQTCRPTLGSDGKPVLRADGTPVPPTCSPNVAVNAAQLKSVNAQIDSTKKAVDSAEADVRQSNEAFKALDGRPIEEGLARAEAEYRAAVNKSQLHSFTGMVRGKASSEVTEAEVKDLEKYLIGIPSIAAAFASTLLAITAVRRIKPQVPAPVVTLPDEAAAYLFGPLLDAIKEEAKGAVRRAANEQVHVGPTPAANAA